jgi:transcriptional regulator with GAF, ATPase, and Fis domain
VAARLASPTLTLEPVTNAHGPIEVRTSHGVVRRVVAPMRIGSARSCDLRLDDRYVSTQHAEVRIEHDRLVLVDMLSKNGTWVAGVRVDCHPVTPGLVVRIGNSTLEFVAGREDDHGDAPHMIGRSAAFVTLLTDLRRVANVGRPVLLRGETGTGKELAARFVHDASSRREMPFVAVNCATIVDSLAESSLFGHVRGAFTGAVRAQVGAFVSATGGTLFLDEVGELPMPLQAKLLRVLETGRVRPVGGDDETEVDVRIVAATHRDLERMVATGRFREDLYHRLGVLVLRMPALRERAADIPLLIDAFARRAAAELRRPIVFAPGCLDLASRAPWPGNIRALHNAVWRAATLDDGPITPQRLLGAMHHRPLRAVESTAAIAADADDRPAPIEQDVSSNARSAEPEESGSDDVSATLSVAYGDWASIEGELLRRLVGEHGSIRRAALALGVPRSTLGARLKRRSSGRG